MDIKTRLADVAYSFKSEECNFRDTCPVESCGECVSDYIVKNVLGLSPAQLLELQKEGAKLVVQCADQTAPGKPSFEVDARFYGFVKVVK
jgi:hypothetical protein